MVDADAKKLSQVFRNLLSNALKFSPPYSTVLVQCCRKELLTTNQNNGGSIRVGVVDSTIRVEVIDYGVAISHVCYDSLH
jgi:signal transduction histidine kinase